MVGQGCNVTFPVVERLRAICLWMGRHRPADIRFRHQYRESHCSTRLGARGRGQTRQVEGHVHAYGLGLAVGPDDPGSPQPFARLRAREFVFPYDGLARAINAEKEPVADVLGGKDPGADLRVGRDKEVVDDVVHQGPGRQSVFVAQMVEGPAKRDEVVRVETDLPGWACVDAAEGAEALVTVLTGVSVLTDFAGIWYPRAALPCALVRVSPRRHQGVPANAGVVEVSGDERHQGRVGVAVPALQVLDDKVICDPVPHGVAYVAELPCGYREDHAQRAVIVQGLLAELVIEIVVDQAKQREILEEQHQFGALLAEQLSWSQGRPH